MKRRGILASQPAVAHPDPAEVGAAGAERASVTRASESSRGRREGRTKK